MNRAAARVWLGLAMYKLPEISFILVGCKIVIMEIGTMPYQPINPASVWKLPKNIKRNASTDGQRLYTAPSGDRTKWPSRIRIPLYFSNRKSLTHKNLWYWLWWRQNSLFLAYFLLLKQLRHVLYVDFASKMICDSEYNSEFNKRFMSGSFQYFFPILLDQV